MRSSGTQPGWHDVVESAFGGCKHRYQRRDRWVFQTNVKEIVGEADMR